MIYIYIIYIYIYSKVILPILPLNPETETMVMSHCFPHLQLASHHGATAFDAWLLSLQEST